MVVLTVETMKSLGTTTIIIVPSNVTYSARAVILARFANFANIHRQITKHADHVRLRACRHEKSR